MSKSTKNQLVPVVVIQHTTPTTDDKHYWFGKQIKKAFGSLFEHFFGDIQIEPDKFGSKQVEITLKNRGCLSCFDASGDFEFLATSQFTYNPDSVEPWELEIKPLDDGFGVEMSVRGKTARACVKGMISERKKFLREELSRLTKHLSSFEDYTRVRKIYG